MINPATELAQIFQAWTSSAGGLNMYGARGGSVGELPVWQAHGRAVVLLRQVEDILESMRTSSGMDTEPFDRYLVAWYKGIFQPDKTWTSAFTGEPASGSSIAALKSLGIIVEMGAAPVRVSEAQRSSIAACLAEALTILDTEDALALDPAERLYIYRLLSEARTSLEERSLTGGMDLRANIDRLNGALLGVAAQFEGIGDQESAARVVGVAGRIVQLLRGVTYDLAAVAQIAGSAFSIGQSAIGAGEPPAEI